MTKSLPVSKRMVYNSYLKVMAKDGGAGIDKQSTEMFNEELSGNLYKIWNRMTSGSYFPPPVRTVFIPKKQGGLRPLGIPTVSDRIAQGVVKDYLEPTLETIFHTSSFGYRPGRSAHDALSQCRDNCIKFAWVIDVDIKGFFDNISHELMMQMLQQHTEEKWVLLYAKRWLKAGVEQEDGSIAARGLKAHRREVLSVLYLQTSICTMRLISGWMKAIRKIHLKGMQMILLFTVIARKKRNSYLQSCKTGCKILNWHYILKRRWLCIARTTSGQKLMNMRASLF